MQKNHRKIMAFVVLVPLCVVGGTRQAPAQAQKAAYPAMAPVDEYLIADQNAEIALARTAAPASIANGAEVMVLGRSGFTTAGERNERFSLRGGAIVGRRDRRCGILESQSSLPHLL